MRICKQTFIKEGFCLLRCQPAPVVFSVTLSNTWGVRDFDCGMVAGATLVGLNISMKGYEWEV